jgi:hypothetical protein
MAKLPLDEAKKMATIMSAGGESGQSISNATGWSTPTISRWLGRTSDRKANGKKAKPKAETIPQNYVVTLNLELSEAKLDAMWSRLPIELKGTAMLAVLEMEE